MQLLKSLPHVLVTLDLDVPIPRWVVGYVDQHGLWYVRDSKRATDCPISPKRRTKIDDVEEWVSDVLDIETASLRRIVDAPCPTWAVVANADSDVSVPAPTASPENERPAGALLGEDLADGTTPGAASLGIDRPTTETATTKNATPEIPLAPVRESNPDLTEMTSNRTEKTGPLTEPS